MIALIITINKYDVCFSSETLTFTCDSITNAYNKLIITLVKYFNIDIDFPDELSEFEYLWFDKQYTKLSMFTYNIYSDNMWNIPWDYQYIYNDILEKINELEIKDAPDFSELYGELNYEDNNNEHNSEDTITRQKSNFFENNNIDDTVNEDCLELEKKIKEIITNTINNP
jgi:hypothetical protein